MKNIKRGTYENKANYIENLNASLYLPELFENAVYIDSKPPQKAKNAGKQIKEYHYFIAPLEMNNGDYRVLITAREKVNSNTLYVVRAEILPNNKRGASAGGQKPTTMIGAPRTVTIANLVNGVNIYDYNLQKNTVYSDSDIKFSLAGIDALTADHDARIRAFQMEQEEDNMASLECSQCKNAIRYHGEPTGIEFVMIRKEDWGRITNSVFDAKAKEFLPGTKYPKLYRTDTIEDDFASSIKKF